MNHTLKYYFGDTATLTSDYTSEGYLVRFTSEDKRDLHNQWFSKHTDFELDVAPIVGKMVLYNHGMHKNIGTVPIGQITDVEIRDDGIFVKKQDRFKEQFQLYAKNRAPIQTLKPAKEFLDEFNQDIEDYEKMLADLRAEGLFKFSSGALPQSVVWDRETGEILKWQIIEGSETATPAEQRGLTQIHTSKSFKSLEIPYLVPTPRGVYTNMFINTSQDDGQPKESMTKEVHKTVEHGEGDSASLPQSVSSKQENLMAQDQKPEQEQEQTAENQKMDSQDHSEMIQRMIREEMDKMTAQSREAEKMEQDDDKEDEMKSFVKSALAEYFDAQPKSEANKAQEQSDIKSIVEETVKAQMESLPTKFTRDENGGHGKSGQVEHISVAESEAYRHLSAEEMALGVKLAYGRLSPYEKRQAKLNHIFSDEYVKSLANKMQVETKYLGDVDPRDKFAAQDRVDLLKSVKHFTKADELNASDITNQGDEWATVYYDTRIWDRVREETRLFNLLTAKGMRIQDLPQGSESMDVYMVTDSGTVYTGRQSNSTNSIGTPETVVDIEPFTTNKVNIPLAKHTLAYGITYELEERSIINVLSVVNEDITATLAEALEDAKVNGHTDLTANNNINLNNSTPATTTFGQTPLYTAWNGIRHAYLVDNTARGDDASASALAVTMFEDTIGLFDKRFRTRRSQMLFIIDDKTEAALRKTSELLTRDTAGETRMTLFTGNVPPLFGVDTYTSGFMKRTGAAGTISSTGDGVSPNLLGGIACVYAPFWQYGRQRRIMIESARNIYAQATGMVATVTHGFSSRGDNAAVGTYNITV
jgi:hypothetical protein